MALPALSLHPALTTPGTRLLVGPPGSGKTTLLMQAAAHAVTQGVLPQRIALLSFAYRNVQFLKQQLAQHHPTLATSSLHVATLRDVAAEQLHHQHLSFISNNDVRRLLRQVINSISFGGTLTEAEHIIRSAKGRAKRLPEADPHYPLFAAYKAALEERKLTDRHDIIRQHLLSIKNDTAQPAPFELMLVDNIQDATELQLIWLKEHHQRGIEIVAAGCDDITAFGRDGAMGTQALTLVEAWPPANNRPVTTHPLSQHHRTPATLAPALAKVMRLGKVRYGIADGTATNTTPATANVHTFTTPQEEMQWLLTQLKPLAQAKPTHPIGVVTRFDQSAQNLTHIFQKNGLRVGSFARLVWEEPSAQLILALLKLLLNLASPAQIAMVMAGFGVPAPLVQQWLTGGHLSQPHFLARGAPLPPTPNLSPPTLEAVQEFRLFLTLAWQGLSTRMADPRDVFLACVGQLLHRLPAADHDDALLAADMLLSLNGKLADILPRVTTETLPDPTSPIIVAPVREVRNFTFSTLYLPQAHHWPAQPLPLLGPAPDHERHLFALALSRSAGSIHLTTGGPQGPGSLVSEFQQSLKTTQRLG